MIVYQSLKSGFISDVSNGDIARIVSDGIHKTLGFSVAQNEYRSFHNSLQFMSGVLRDTLIPANCGVCIEYKIPNTSQRIDFIVSGINSLGKHSAVIVELKQWESAEKLSEGKDMVLTYVNGGIHQRTHPSYQAWSYASTIDSYNQNVQDLSIVLKPCAFLHNYERRSPEPIENQIYEDIISRAPLFMKNDGQKLSEFIERLLVKGDNKETIELIECGKIKPSKMLQDCLFSMLDGNEEFVMIEEQKLVFENAKILARRCKNDHKKRVYIIEGGPGTGKSVVAINLLVQFIGDGMVSKYVTKNSAPRNVYFSHLREKGKRNVEIKHLFAGSGEFVECPSNTYGALIADESHRLNGKSGMFRNKGENQIKEIINASELSIFFIDEDQRIHITDIGRIEEIENWASSFGAEVKRATLTSQFRCNGSDAYLAWLDNTLQIRETAHTNLDIDYDFRVVDSPSELYQLINEKNNEIASGTNRIRNKSRLLAGYCWEWISSGQNDLSVHDINIDDFHKSWNLKNSIWAIDPSSIEQVGCIHTSQGLEFDYIGVIIGPDISFVDGKIVTEFKKRAKSDKSMHGIKKLHRKNPEEANKLADLIIKNTYRTLLTRGQKGCYIYCCDPLLAEHFRNFK